MATTKTTTTPAVDEPSVAQATTDGNTANELARIQANQDRYDARVSGKSSAEVNAEEAEAAAKDKEAPEVAPGGGQTVPAHDASGEPSDDATVVEVPEVAEPTPVNTSAPYTETKKSSSGSSEG